MSKFTALLNLNDFADAKKVMETLKSLPQSTYVLAQTAYQIKETQPSIARNFLKTVIQECEDEEIKEVDGGSDEQSSSTTGLEKIGSNEQVTDMENSVDTKDQMGVSIGEMAPPMGMPPQQPPQMPPQQPQVPQQQMQYTIQEATAIRKQFRLVQEALKEINKQIRETAMASVKSMDVGIGAKGTPTSGSFIRETVNDLEGARTNIKKLNDAFNDGRA